MLLLIEGLRSTFLSDGSSMADSPYLGPTTNIMSSLSNVLTPKFHHKTLWNNMSFSCLNVMCSPCLKKTSLNSFRSLQAINGSMEHYEEAFTNSVDQRLLWSVIGHSFFKKFTDHTQIKKENYLLLVGLVSLLLGNLIHYLATAEECFHYCHDYIYVSLLNWLIPCHLNHQNKTLFRQDDTIDFSKQV